MPVFTTAQKADIAEYAIVLSQRFYALTRRTLGEIAYRLAGQNNIRHKFYNGSAGKDWIQGFLDRHEHLCWRM
ncbi:unnamed protein product, partial [Allacma fusca]